MESSGSPLVRQQKSVDSAEKSLAQLTEASPTQDLLESVAQTSNPIMKWLDRQQHGARQDYMLWHGTVVICH